MRKDQGDVTIISSKNDACKIKWIINDSHALMRCHYGTSSENIYYIRDIESKPVRLWGYNWTFKLQGLFNRDKSSSKVTLIFEPMEIELWNGKRHVKTKTCLTATFTSQSGFGGKVFNVEDGASKWVRGYDMFLLTSNELSYGFKMEFIWSINLERRIEDLVPDTTMRFNSISGDFGKMLEDTNGHDLIIRCGRVELTAHKCILAGRSSVFQAMFQTDMKEAKESLVEINEVSPESIQAMLNWIYTCQIDDKGKLYALDLLRLAHLYEMPLLMDECQVFLISQIKKENATDILVLADMVEAKEVKKAAINFIIGDKSIIKMNEFLKKVSKELLAEIILAHN